MELQPKHPSIKGPVQWFCGDVWIDTIVSSQEPSPLNVVAVHFAPGGRTAWHSHEGGQTLYVTEGKGLVQSRGEPVAEMSPGDVVFTPDGEDHWHGATKDNFMTHFSITRGAAQWGQLVTDDEYDGRSS